jgi:MarR family transcriptional regulator for hemolysin
MLAELERATHLIGAYLERAELGITQAEAHVLAQLGRHGPSTVGALHDEFGHKRSTLTSVLDRLEARGLVVRTVNQDDRRSFVVSTTRKGTAAARKVVAALDELERAVAAEVNARDVGGVEAVAAALGRLVPA